MATREGIYVRGHEIVQRYVGNRLVWEKWVISGVFYKNLNDYLLTHRYIPQQSDKTSVFRVSEGLNIDEIDGSTRVKKSNTLFKNVVVSKLISGYNFFDNEFAIIFSSADEKNRFNRITGETRFYKKRGS